MPVPHDCEECLLIRNGLQGRTWDAISSEFLQANPDSLPLLSAEAYRAFLPAWLREGLITPDSEVAAMLLVNLRMDPETQGFTAEQGRLIVEVARAIAAKSLWGINDPVHVDSLAAIEDIWGRLP